MGTIVMKLPMDRARVRFLAAILAFAVPSIALADSLVQILPGATTQFRLCASDPDPNADPIVIEQLGPDFGAVGVALLGAPEAAGTAVIDGGSTIIRTVSPMDTTGLSSEPMVAMTVAVSDQASTGATINLTLGGVAPT